MDMQFSQQLDQAKAVATNKLFLEKVYLEMRLKLHSLSLPKLKQKRKKKMEENHA